eukprot:CAMPEP_0197715250 /NCGR_PEP_ID=MMETSP1434-20131217/452_1 /TAXON_ID=265543 /ORGANISM="Minutocellus polymorphus, Strain CCMP3303" /LENGTH=323 /DNA_ID=CAMNT_0043299313 /DNA_START=24 /DNA_END=995 /DNA_ORIENTATION=+
MKRFLHALACLAIAVATVAGGECPFCLDGSAPPTPDKELPGLFEGATCADAASVALTLEDPESFACIQVQDVGLAECGCTTPEELDMNCTLCADGSPVPNPDLAVSATTCGGVERFIRRFGQSTCRAYHRTIGVHCGCVPPEPPVEVCQICGDSPLAFPAAPLFVEELGTDIPCAFFEVIANDEEDNGGFPCAAFQIEGRAACCEGGGAGLEPAPDDVDELCAEENVSGPGFFDCALACSPAQCCEDASCSSGLPNCLTYLPCTILDTAPVPGESDVTEAEKTDPEPQDPAEGDDTTSSSSHTCISIPTRAAVTAGLALVAFW